MAERKKFLLRIPPELWEELNRWAGQELRSVNGQIEFLLREAVRRRKRGDVRVGVFLSGGIDSAAMLAHLADQEGPGVPVFSIGHTDPAFDEAGFARTTARHFDADFDALVLKESDLAEGLRRVGNGLDEPLGDASTIPTHLLALHARQKVKVSSSPAGPRSTWDMLSTR